MSTSDQSINEEIGSLLNDARDALEDGQIDYDHYDALGEKTDTVRRRKQRGEITTEEAIDELQDLRAKVLK